MRINLKFSTKENNKFQIKGTYIYIKSVGAVNMVIGATYTSSDQFCVLFDFFQNIEIY